MGANQSSNCCGVILPDDIIINIIARLPVKSIVQYRSVCKDWNLFFSSKVFRDLHLNLSFLNPANGKCFVTYNGFDNNPLVLMHCEVPVLRMCFKKFRFQDFIGCCKGLICMKTRKKLVLWNPAIMQSKYVQIPQFGEFTPLTFGFGYKSSTDSFFIVMLLGKNSRGTGGYEEVLKAVVYCTTLDLWSTVDACSEMYVDDGREQSIVVVKGDPYWRGVVRDNSCLISYDAENKSFKIIPPVGRRDYNYVDWNGELAAVERSRSPSSINVFVYDKLNLSWSSTRLFAEFQVAGIESIQCSPNYFFITTGWDTRNATLNKYLQVLNYETGEAGDRIQMKRTFPTDMYSYTKSLFVVEGMGAVDGTPI